MRRQIATMVSLSKPDSLAGSKSPAAVSVSNSNLTAEERFLCHKTELHQRLIRGMDLSAIDWWIRLVRAVLRQAQP